MPEVAVPWERQPGESAKAFAAFAHYRDLGPGRSLRQTGADLPKSIQLLKRWSTRWDWRERAQAHDAEQDRTGRAAAAEAAREEAEQLRRRQLQDGRDLQRLARAGVAQLIERDSETGESRLRRQLKVTEIVALHRYGGELERESGAPQTGEPAAAGPDEDDPLTDLLRSLPQEEFKTLLEAARSLVAGAKPTRVRKTRGKRRKSSDQAQKGK